LRCHRTHLRPPALRRHRPCPRNPPILRCRHHHRSRRCRRLHQPASVRPTATRPPRSRRSAPRIDQLGIRGLGCSRRRSGRRPSRKRDRGTRRRAPLPLPAGVRRSRSFYYERCAPVLASWKAYSWSDALAFSILAERKPPREVKSPAGPTRCQSTCANRTRGARKGRRSRAFRRRSGRSTRRRSSDADRSSNWERSP
jgi:hypothetical protein